MRRTYPMFLRIESLVLSVCQCDGSAAVAIHHSSGSFWAMSCMKLPSPSLPDSLYTLVHNNYRPQWALSMKFLENFSRIGDRITIKTRERRMFSPGRGGRLEKRLTRGATTRKYAESGVLGSVEIKVPILNTKYLMRKVQFCSNFEKCQNESPIYVCLQSIIPNGSTRAKKQKKKKKKKKRSSPCEMRLPEPSGAPY